jgi:hypothetical protein
MLNYFLSSKYWNQFFLHAANEMEFDEFLESGWIIMKPYYLKDKTQV